MEQWSAVFTEGAKLDYSESGAGFGTVGPEELAHLMRGEAAKHGYMPQIFKEWQHLVGLPLVKINDDKAKAWSEFLATHSSSSTAKNPLIFKRLARFEDELVRTKDGWRISKRKLFVTYNDTFKTI